MELGTSATRLRSNLVARVAWLLPLSCYVAVAAVVFVRHGVPIERGRLSLWILGGLACISLARPVAFVRDAALDWLPLLAALTLYDVLRGAGGGALPVHGEFQIWLDRHVFGFGSVPTVWLQQHLYDPARLSWLDYAAWGVYMSYFVASPIALGAVWALDRPTFRRYARQLTLLSFAAVAAFTVWPSRPPWLASADGLLPPTTRIAGVIAASVHPFDGTSIWEQGLRLANQVAAFPSLHEAMTILLVVVLWRRAPGWLRPVLAAYPLAMAFALTYTAEHYVADLAAGAALTAAVVVLEPRLASRLRTWAGGPAARRAGRAFRRRSPRTGPPASRLGARPNT